MGTINIETDSVRKYTEDKYTHGPDKYKHGQNSKAKVHGTNTSKKREAKRRLTRIDESQDESLSENGQAPTKRKRKQRKKLVRKEGTQADSDEGSVSSADCFKPNPEVGVQHASGGGSGGAGNLSQPCSSKDLGKEAAQKVF
jgi:hypothetical protein